MTASEVNSSISSPATTRSADVYSRLVTLISDYTGESKENIKMETELKNGLGFDSMDMLNLYSFNTSLKI